ncbi:hypothetical protein MOQ_009996 [Trypanosoma cruzi marinkellei]|uniref:Uncharacterized protein n=1 Tax=Trypanosoma cruzi marinkellei TaxID=85056 RepID=K2MV72_TRYCR|nr:hypothetical protein MOQ_009996 [Trypanosoma cruzi marinkellei]
MLTGILNLNLSIDKYMYLRVIFGVFLVCLLLHRLYRLDVVVVAVFVWLNGVHFDCRREGCTFESCRGCAHVISSLLSLSLLLYAHPFLFPIGRFYFWWVAWSLFLRQTASPSCDSVMPAQFLLVLPPVDGPTMTEEVLAQQVMQEFIAMRHAGSSVELLCSVSSVRLQRTIAERYPLACNRLLMEGRWRGKWHCFAEEIVRLRCFLYTMRDYAENKDLEVHIAPSELRCCLREENHCAVRLTDGSVGALLREHLLQEGALHRWCDAAVEAGAADGVLWRAPPPAPTLMELAKQLAPHESEGGSLGQLRRGAAKEVAVILTASDTLARHMSVMRLRRHVAHCLESWVPANSDK